MSPERAPEARPLDGTPYDLVRLIGKGSMGEVYEAVHRTLGKKRAVKLLAAHLVHRPDLAERMRVEAQLLANIRHENLVEVVDLGVSHDGRLYFVMDLLEGHTLRGTISANAPMRPALALELVIPILDGLAAAHAAGVVHRDVKPENVFVLAASGAVKVLDFGVAKVGQTAATVTHTSFTAGTPRYMAPEQVDGRPSDPRTDLFACGAVLFELLSGTGPFDRDERMALAFAILTADPAPLESPHPISARLRTAVARALQKNPDFRFTSAAEMATELRTCLAEELRSAVGGPGSPNTTQAMPPNTTQAMPPNTMPRTTQAMPPRSAPPSGPVSAPPMTGPVSTPPVSTLGPASAVALTTPSEGGGRAVFVVGALLLALALVAGGVGWWAARPKADAPPAPIAASPRPTVTVAATTAIPFVAGATSTSAASQVTPSATALAPPPSAIPNAPPSAAHRHLDAGAKALASAAIAPPPSASSPTLGLDTVRRPGSGL